MSKSYRVIYEQNYGKIPEDENGTHNFLGGELQRELVRLNKHASQNGYRKKDVENGTHNFLGGKIQSKHNQRRLKEKTHHLLKKECCPYCNKTGTGMIMKRWHFDNCKERP